MRQNKPFHRAIIFSGGGTRFAIYCGMYAAMIDLNMKPDVIISSCGGSIAGTIIKRFPNNDDQKKYLQSEELYSFIKNTRLTKERKIHRIGRLVLKKVRNKNLAPYVEDIFNRYLVEMQEDISSQLPSLVSKRDNDIKLIIIGSQLLFDKTTINDKRNNNKLYKKIIFTDIETASLIDTKQIEIESENYINSAVSSSITIKTDVPWHIAMRISLSDMFYVSPVFWHGDYYAGGAIDLIPIELAQHLADNVIMEHKKGYTKVEESLVRAVLGYSGNQRLKEVYQYVGFHRIDTSDIKKVLNGHYCKKKLNWLQFKIEMELPNSYQQFCEDMHLQWQYGYNKMRKTLLA